MISTLPSALLRTQPAIARMCASRSTNQRKPTPCTRPRTTKRRACTSSVIELYQNNSPAHFPQRQTDAGDRRALTRLLWNSVGETSAKTRKDGEPALGRRQNKQ